MNENKIKIGVLCICLNQPYWEYANEMLYGLNTFFLKHPSIKDKYEVQMMLWSDMPEPQDEKFWITFKKQHEEAKTVPDQYEKFVTEAKVYLEEIRKLAKIFPTESIEWPMPTLMRYHLFLQQEELIKDFDYLFYIDVDMRITDWIGEEILGEGLTASQHPMYALRQNLYAPYEPNPQSTAYIPLPGRILKENNNLRFEPLYYAGGFQGGKTEDFIKAMKVMRERIDKDFGNNYIARWNDESHWNRYLYEVSPTVVLSPSYIYPDSLVSEYYVKKVWGRNYSPKIMTLTKKFTTTSEGGEAVRKLVQI